MRHDESALLARLLQSFDDVFATPSGLPPSHLCDHHIHLKPNTVPMAVRPYRYPQLQKDELEAQCAAMLAQGTIRPSTSPFSAPVLLVKKPDDSWRFCVDYRALNECTVKDKFPIPVVEELLDELHGARVFTKLDLRSVYHQYLLRGAPSASKRYFRGPTLSWFACQTIKVFLCHHEHRLPCHVISSEGVAMDNDKVEAVASWPQPRSAHSLHGFLGLAGYYRRFIKDFGAIAAPLTQLLKKDVFLWSEAAATAFAALKQVLTEVPVLHLPDFSQEFMVDCDASGTGFGVLLHQGDGPIAYFSRQFAPCHLKIATYERELIGLVQAVRH
jgi:hypothetical protein